MIQDIAPKVYHNEIRWQEPAANDCVLCYRDKKVYIKLEGEAITYPTVTDLPADVELQYAFSVDERAYYLLESEPPEEQGGWKYESTGLLRGFEASVELFACGVGESLSRWYHGNRFCGACGERMEKSKSERAMVCPKCGNTVYPKICPAVIVAIHDGDRLVLTRYKGRAFKKYALVAGFAEIGESIEQTVRREVMEETGLRVKNLRFYKSQPWVFTDTLLMGFYAELDGPDEIHVQEDELAEGNWFLRSELPEDHSHISLTGEMIEQFRQGNF